MISLIILSGRTAIIDECYYVWVSKYRALVLHRSLFLFVEHCCYIIKHKLRREIAAKEHALGIVYRDGI